ncbi:Dual specificity protein phosphatase 1 [Hibiscus syriacus]|uniref:Dual specificity protein phosphatase 1 n=1 Tax=Hibiscus syriacus TaxID=106335 RepID=A0A6A3CMF7_HIBSY|nr:Dual specificity protein phosphatase 1 [Hibiscus syriacus]
MSHIDDSMRKQIAALLRVVNFRRTFKDTVPSVIEEGLFLGSIAASNNVDALKRLNVTHILTVASSLKPAHTTDFVYKVIPVADKEDTNISQYFDECFNFIDEARRQGGGVLVHCFVGKSRSVTIIVAYLMKKHGMSLSEALEHVRSKRPLAAPNPGFILQLKEFENSFREQMKANE